MLSLKSTFVVVITLALLTVNLVYAAPVGKVEKRLLSPLAPVASAFNGVSIILENDVDSSKAKYSFLLLSQPRGYYAGMGSCLTIGDGGYIYIPGTAGATSLVSLLNNNVATQQEVSGYSQFWVFNGKQA
ncbi:hypothetical protein F5H01DRAFT_319009 [Linnemannia elongata]|nr:hypothetical protein F5H01DRAFT_319009 [Linnemannia elongata]